MQNNQLRLQHDTQEQPIITPREMNGSSSSTAVSSPISSPLLGRPMSLGNLLIQRDHGTHSKTASIVSKRSYDVLSPRTSSSLQHQLHNTSSAVVPTPLGEQPVPSTSTNSAASRHNHTQQQDHFRMSIDATATSPTSSIYSIASSTPSTAVFPTATRTVLLPQNNHGVRTRVNILPASAAASSRNSINTLTKERRVSSLENKSPSTSSSTHLYPTHHQPEKSSTSLAGLIRPRLTPLDPPPRLQSVAATSSVLVNRINNKQMPDPVRSASPSLASTSYAANARRAVSDSTTRPDSPRSLSIASHASINSPDTEDYRFPAPSSGTRNTNQTHVYASATSPTTTVPSGGMPQPGRSATSPLILASEFGSLTAQAATSPMLAGSSGNHLISTSALGSPRPTFATPPPAHPAYQRSHTTDGAYNLHSMTAPWEPSSSSSPLMRPQAPFTSHSSKPSRTHLANLPKSLIPGGYDFSPVSTSTHDSAHTYTHHQSSHSASAASAFAYARDRSASVPRTVSSFGDNDSSRSSMDRPNGQQHIAHQYGAVPAVPEIDASFQTAKQTMENGNTSHNQSGIVGGNDSGHVRLPSGPSNVSQSNSSRQSTEEEDSGTVYDALAPLISPIPPKLDLDFGNSSGFSLDFGGDFSSSLALGGSGGSLGLSFGDFGRKQSLPHNQRAAQQPTAREAQVREKNDSTATTTMSSFLSLQDSTMSTHISDISFLDHAKVSAVPPLSGASEMTIGPPPPLQEHLGNLTVQQAPSGNDEEEDEEDGKPLGAILQTKVDQKSPSRFTPTASSSGGRSFSDLSGGQRSQDINAPEVVASTQASIRSNSRLDTALRSESPASFVSSTSLSRPESSLFMAQGNIAAEGTSRKRLIDKPAYNGENNDSEDSKRTTLSSGEQQVPNKTSNNSSSANLPSLALQHNPSVRVSINKSLPPVPPGDVERSPQGRGQTRPGTSSSQASSIDKGALPVSTSSRDQLGIGLQPNREQMGAGRRSYSEHSQSYGRQESSNSKRQDSETFSCSQDDFRTPQFGKTYEDNRATCRASGSDTVSMRSSSTSGYTSSEVTRNFSVPVAPEATRVYRASTESENIARQGRSEQARTRATTLDTESIRNPFDSNRSSKQDIPLATLARPKPHARNAWPNGELRKRDAITDKLLETVSAKLDVWITRHPERLMTVEEAERHNRTPSPKAAEPAHPEVQASPKPVSRIPPPVVQSVPSEAPSLAAGQSLDAKYSVKSTEPSWSSKNASSATTVVANIPPPKIEAMQPPADLSRMRANAKASSSAARPSEPAVPLQAAKSPSAQGPSSLLAPSAPSSLPALTHSSSFTTATPSDSLASTSKTSDLSRTPLTALPSSPSLDPSLATTVPLKIVPKSRTAANSSKVRKPLSPGGEQPWSQAWLDITDSLTSYKSAYNQQKQERASFIQTGLLPHFKEEEHSALLRNRTLSIEQKEVLLDWVDILFEDLQGTPPNRGACLDGIAAIIESRLMSYFAFPSGSDGFKRFERTIATLAAFAVEKLNGKAIFANTLGFAGKMLAAAFWNLDGVALKLLRLLPAVKKQHVARIHTDAGIAECPGKFPIHLEALAFDGSPAEHMKLFRPVKPGADGDSHLYKATFDLPSTGKVLGTSNVDAKGDSNTGSREINIEMAGNWLIRWTATDSDLPFAFMRAYHRQLSNYLPLYQPDLTDPLSTAQLIRAPGYAFISATLLEVCDALIHRNLRSVTTMAPSNAGVNANESANLAAGQKPKSLEIVSKRVIQTVFEVVGGALQAGTPESSSIAFASAALRHNFGASLSMWIRAVTKKTSMWDTRGIFALLDLIEGLMYNVCCPPYEEGVEEDDEVWIPSEVGLKLFDTKFILSFIKTILSKADNTTCLLRTISFLYTEFQSFTLRMEDREEVCDRVILDSEVFERLFLYYNVGVRGYFLRLLVYRLARLGSSDDGKPATRDPSIFSTLRLFEYRLEKIRKRHDEIDPLDDWDSDSSDDFRPLPKRSTVCSTWGVRDKPWAMDLARIGERNSSDSSEDEGGQEGVERVHSSLQDIQETGADEGTTTLAMGQGDMQVSEDRPASRKSSRKLSTSSTWLMPPIPTQHPAVTTSCGNAKKGVAKSAMKVWNALTNRKNQTGGISSGRNKTGMSSAVAPFYDDVQLDQSGLVEVTLPLERSDGQGRRSSSSSVNRKHALNGASEAGKLSLENTRPFPESHTGPHQGTKASSQASGDQVLSINVPSKSDLQGLEAPPPRLRKKSSRKSIRRGANQSTTANGRLSAMSPRSRRSSMYSFDLDTETPRSDSFDLPRSPLLASSGGIVQSGPTSPAVGSNAGVLSLSPVAFGALMDGALNFNLDSDDANGDRSGDRLTPGGHKRLKSVSSARNRSRPVSVASDRTGPSPRVSKRFSKRASILPPPALDLLKESPSEPVPKIPEQYKSPTTCGDQANNGSPAINSALRVPSPEPYERKLHPYAIRGLREYEDCLDEWELFVHRVKEEEGVDGRELAALIPRLQCAWPSTWEE